MQVYRKIFIVLCILLVECFACVDDSGATDREIVICAKNEYVSECGDYKVGTYWLRGTGWIIAPRDFYDYAPDAKANNMKNLRAFFSTESEAISITQNHQGTSEQGLNPSVWYEQAQKILAFFCNPEEVSVKCEKCPNNGQTSQTTITYDTETETYSDYKFNSIANCMVPTCVDEKGEYVYKDEDSDKSYGCFYGSADIEVTGDQLPVITVTPTTNIMWEHFPVFSPTYINIGTGD